MNTEFNKALKYMASRKNDKAISLFKKVLKQHECKEAWLNLGTCYKNTNQFILAEHAIRKSMQSDMPYHDNTFSTAYPMALNNLGLLYYTYERDAEAVDLYLESLKYAPDNYNAMWNLAEVSLRQYSSRKHSSLKTCWDLYECRFKRLGGVVLKNKKEDLISWDGISRVPSIVVLTEQGLGDMIMFGRYLSLLEQYADKIWIQCTPILDGLFDKYNICRDPIETDATHGVAMCSLGRVFCLDIPKGDWLKDKYVTKSTNGTFDIGVAWSGNSDHSNDHNRSTSSGRFLPLSRWGRLHTINPTEHGTKGFSILEGASFAETAKNLSKLDLVITVDTSVAHLCGALGMECWVLMPLYTTDFRWGDSSMGYDNIWYSSVRVIRNPGSWEKVFLEVNKLLEARCAV